MIKQIKKTKSTVPILEFGEEKKVYGRCWYNKNNIHLDISIGVVYTIVGYIV